MPDKMKMMKKKDMNMGGNMMNAQGMMTGYPQNMMTMPRASKSRGTGTAKGGSGGTMRRVYKY